MNWQQRIANYERETGYPQGLFVGGDDRLSGIWLLGNDYRVKSGYYGGYPATFLKRVKALFPDKKNVLHLFSGKVDTETFPGHTVDINPELKPDYLDDAQSLKEVPLELYDLVLCDAPYSVEDAEHYGTSMVKRNLVMKALTRLTRGAHLVILDQVLWMWSKEQFALEGMVGVIRSSNHRFRIMTVFRKL